MPPLRSTLASAISTMWSSSDAASYSQTNIIPFYCAVLAAIVVGLVLYVVVKHRRSRKHKQTGVVLTYVAVATGGGECGVTHKLSSDSGVGLEQDSKPGRLSLSGPSQNPNSQNPSVFNLIVKNMSAQSIGRSWGKPYYFNGGRSHCLCTSPRNS